MPTRTGKIKLPVPLKNLDSLLRRAERLTLQDQKKRASRISPGEILTVLCSDPEIRRIKKIFWGKAVNADVISFNHGALREPGVPSVEIIINVQQAKRQQLWGWKEEIVFLFIHGLLHAIGYDDDTPAKRKRMLDLGEKVLWKVLPPSASKK